MKKFVLLIVISLVVVFMATTKVVVVCGSSMEPTYHSGQVLFLGQGCPKKGEVGVFKDPKGSTIIKRVAYVEGDCIPLKGNSWELVNKIPKDLNRAAKLGCSIRFYTIPKGMVYVLGDNVANSEDSRTVGPVKVSECLGRIL